MQAQLDRIRAKVHRAEDLFRSHEWDYLTTPNVVKVFGARTHRYRLNPPLPLDEMERWEETYRTPLPAPYRAFLAAVGDGGAGPCHGLFPLREWDRGCLVAAEVLPDWPSTPCLLRTDYPPGPDTEAWLVEVGGPDWEDRFNADAWDPLVGCLTLCEVGCGGYIYLVLNGPLTGRVCFAEHLCRPGFAPQADFLDYYEAWIDDALADRPAH